MAHTANEIKSMRRDIAKMRQTLLEKQPTHFSGRYAVDAFFGALFIGLTFIMKGSVLRIAEVLNLTHIFFILLATGIILTAQIFFVGYVRVKSKARRPFFEFWFKRFATLFFIAMFTSFMLVYLFGINLLVHDVPFRVFQVVILLTMPSAIGAAIPSLLRKY